MSTLSQHRAIHSDARPYVCEFCRKTFNRVSTLISHKKTHSDYKPHKCHICGKAFHQKGYYINSLVMWRTVHINNFWFFESGNLRNHIFTHTNERPYKCDICTKGFNQMSNLMCHKVVPRGEDAGWWRVRWCRLLQLTSCYLFDRHTHIRRRACTPAYDAVKFSIRDFHCEITRNTFTELNIQVETSTTTRSKWARCGRWPTRRTETFLSLRSICRKSLRVVHLPNENRTNIEQFDKTEKVSQPNKSPLQRLKITKTYITDRGVVTEKVRKRAWLCNFLFSSLFITFIVLYVLASEHVCRHSDRSHKNKSNGNGHTERPDTFCPVQTFLGNSGVS